MTENLPKTPDSGDSLDEEGYSVFRIRLAMWHPAGARRRRGEKY